MDQATTDTFLAHALDDWYLSIGRQFGPLTRPQRRILRLIAGAPGLRVGDVAERLGLTTAGATRMVDKLEALGYAYRFRAPEEDQRIVHVALTEAGTQALDDADHIFVQAVGKTLAALTADERAALSHLLHTILATVPHGSSQRSSAPMGATGAEGQHGE